MNLIVDLLGSATKIHLTSKANISTFPESGCITSSTRPKGLPGAKRESNSKKPCYANQMSRARWVAQPIGRLLWGGKWKMGRKRGCVNRLCITRSAQHWLKPSVAFQNQSMIIDPNQLNDDLSSSEETIGWFEQFRLRNADGEQI